MKPGSGAHPASCSMGTLKGVRCLGCDSDQAPPSTTKVKIEWKYISASHIFQNSVDWDKCSSCSSIVA